MYTLSLSPRYLYEPDGVGSLEVVTGALNSTISVPDTAIAEYSPTVTVEVTGATPVNFTSQPIREWLSVFSIASQTYCTVLHIRGYFMHNDARDIVLILLFWQCQKMMIWEVNLLQWTSMDPATVLSHVWQWTLYKHVLYTVGQVLTLQV